MQLLTSCPLFFILSSLLGGCNSKATASPPKSDDRMKKSGQSCIRKEVTSYKIHTLGVTSHFSVLTSLQNFTWFCCTYFTSRYFKDLFESCFIHFQKPFAKHFLLIFLTDHVWLPFEDQSSTTFLLDSKVIYPKYSKHWPYHLAATLSCG